MENYQEKIAITNEYMEQLNREYQESLIPEPNIRLRSPISLYKKSLYSSFPKNITRYRDKGIKTLSRLLGEQCEKTCLEIYDNYKNELANDGEIDWLEEKLIDAICILRGRMYMQKMDPNIKDLDFNNKYGNYYFDGEYVNLVIYRLGGFIYRFPITQHLNSRYLDFYAASVNHLNEKGWFKKECFDNLYNDFIINTLVSR